MYNQLCAIVEACIKLQTIFVVFASTFFDAAKVTIIYIRRLCQIWQRAKNLSIFSIFLALHLLAPCLEIWPAYGEVGVEKL
jgi:hypothetical protein